MKRFPCVLTLLAAILAVLVLPSKAQGAEISSFRGTTGSVEFYSTDPTGCIVTSVTVFANESRDSVPSAPRETNAGVYVTIHVFNSCTWEQMACGAGSLDLADGAFNFTGHLASATLSATGQVYDFCTGTDRPVTMALTWTGEGDVVLGRSNFSTHAPGYHVSYRQRGQYRDAMVAGSMTLDGSPLSLGTSLGYFTQTSSGTITRYR